MQRSIPFMACLMLAACSPQSSETAKAVAAPDSVDQALDYCDKRPVKDLNEADAKDLFCKGSKGTSATEFGYLKKSAEMGYAPAQMYVAISYKRGEGVAADVSQAQSWYLKAAEQGSAEAQNSYGYMFFYGEGVPEDPAKAIPWFRKAAAQDYAHSQTLLGEAYYEGNGVAKDNNQAFRFYSQAAANDHPFATFVTGILYVRGHGVFRDEAKGARLVTKAAEWNVPEAQVELAEYYEDGTGVAINDVTALKWYEVARLNGQDTASKTQKVVARLSPKQVQQAKVDANAAYAKLKLEPWGA